MFILQMAQTPLPSQTPSPTPLPPGVFTAPPRRVNVIVNAPAPQAMPQPLAQPRPSMDHSLRGPYITIPFLGWRIPSPL